MRTLTLLLVLVGTLSGGALAVDNQPCHDYLDATTPTSRFQDNGDGTVTDLWTQLVWARCPIGYSFSAGATAAISDDSCSVSELLIFTWQQALIAIGDLEGGWRLPNSKELATLVERRCYAPAINLVPFPDTPRGTFWSASPLVDGTPRAWGVGFEFGTLKGHAISDQLYIRTVRGEGL